MTELEKLITKLRWLIVELKVLIANLKGFRRSARDLAMRRGIYRWDS